MKEKDKKQRIARALATLTKFERTILIIKLAGWLIRNRIQKIPHYIITPDGVHINRRHVSQFVPSERRIINIIRYKLHVWYYGLDDDGSFTS